MALGTVLCWSWIEKLNEPGYWSRGSRPSEPEGPKPVTVRVVGSGAVALGKMLLPKEGVRWVRRKMMVVARRDMFLNERLGDGEDAESRDGRFH